MVTKFEDYSFMNDSEDFLNQPGAYKTDKFVRKRRRRPKKTYINELPGIAKNARLLWDRYF